MHAETRPVRTRRASMIALPRTRPHAQPVTNAPRSLANASLDLADLIRLPVIRLLKIEIVDPGVSATLIADFRVRAQGGPEGHVSL